MKTSRIHGLDTLRALAIVLVVLHHYVLFVSPAADVIRFLSINCKICIIFKLR